MIFGNHLLEDFVRITELRKEDLIMCFINYFILFEDW